MTNDFKPVTDGGGYRHRLGDRGRVTLLGVSCPQCKHVFMPKLLPALACPKCGHKPAPL